MKFIANKKISCIKKHTSRFFRKKVVVMAIFAIAIAGFWLIKQHQLKSEYAINAGIVSLIGKQDTRLTDELKYDGDKRVYKFNKSDENPSSTDETPGSITKKVGKPTTSLLYSGEFQRSDSHSVEIIDVNSSLSLKSTPLFELKSGKKTEDGRLVYPLEAKEGQVVYTFTSSGIKEDIVLRSNDRDELSFDFNLDIPSELSIKTENDGTVGVYSADPALFGNVSTGSDKDKETLEKARKNGEKKYKVFVLPKPVIYQSNDSGGRSNVGVDTEVYYEINGNTLTVKAKGLSNLKYPITIDPSFDVTSTEDFQKGNEDGDSVEFDNEVKRSDTGGKTGAWTNASNTFTTSRQAHCSFQYNGYIYVMGGNNFSSTVYGDIQYSAIGSNGAPGTWSTDSYTMPTEGSAVRHGMGCAVYNGYIYIVGGCVVYNCSTRLSTVYYAKLKTTGGLDSAFSSTSSLSTATAKMGVVAVNGYLYSVGGSTSTGAVTTVQKADIKADGTLGTWNSTSSLSVSRGDIANMVSAYNGYIYAVGGAYACSSNTCGRYTTDYAKINPDGTLGTWAESLSMGIELDRYNGVAVAYNGILIIEGGNAGYHCSTPPFGCTANYNHQGQMFAYINSDGSIAKYDASYGNYNTYQESGYVSKQGTSYAIYSGYLYLTGDSNVLSNATHYAKLGSTGDICGRSTSIRACNLDYLNDDDMPSGNDRRRSAMIIYNDCVYMIGGENYSGTRYDDIQRASINSDGNLSAWTDEGTDGNMGASIAGHSATVYNGRVYVMGGDDSGGARSTVSYMTLPESGCDISSGATWTDASNGLGAARTNGGGVVSGNRLYYYGGENSNGGTAQSTVYYSAEINKSTGDLGSAWTSGNALGTARKHFGVAVYNNYLYALGGEDASGTPARLSSVEKSLIDSSGVPGTWATTTSIQDSSCTTQARSRMATYAYNGNIYLTGGNTGSVGSDTKIIKIKSDGTLESCWQDSVSFIGGGSARDRHSMAVYKSIIYIAGGDTGAATLRSEATTSLVDKNQSDSQVAWTTDGDSVGADKVHHCTVVFSGTSSTYIYVIGGTATDTGTASTEIRKATISSDGTVSSWSTSGMTALSPGLKDQACAVGANNYLYVLGGTDASGNQVSTVQYSLLSSSDGTNGTWSTTDGLDGNDDGDATDDYDKRIKLQAVINNGYLYAIGGQENNSPTFSSHSGVQYIDVNNDGTLGDTGGNDWSATSTLGTKRYDHAVSIMNGYLYIIGGYDNADVSDRVSTVEYAKFNPNGTLESWRYTTSLPVATEKTTSVALNGYIFITGGLEDTGSGTYVNDSWAAPVLTKGQIGEWRRMSNNITNARSNHASATHNGRIYIIGGWNGSSYYQDVQYVQPNLMPRTGQYSRLFIDGTSNKIFSTITYNGTKLDNERVDISYVKSCSTAFDYGGGKTTISSTTPATDYTINKVGKYFIAIFNFDYTNGARYPYEASNVTDFSIDYTNGPPTQDSYMRHGKWFTTNSSDQYNPPEVEQPFDTTPDGLVICS